MTTMSNSNFLNKSVQLAFLITIALFITQNAFGQNLKYGQKVYILNDQLESAIWSEKFHVFLKDRSEDPHDQRFLWVIQRDVETIGTGPVRFGDRVCFKSVGATVYDFSNRILSGSRGNPGVVVANDEKRGNVGSSPSWYKWEVRRSKTSTGSGIVQMGDPILLLTRFNGWMVNTGDNPGTPFGVNNLESTVLQWRIEPYQKYRIGDTHAGGIIFYLDPDGVHGLVAAPSDLSVRAKWGCRGLIDGIVGVPNLFINIFGSSGAVVIQAQPTNIPGADIGWGAINTSAILSECDEADIAARLCDDLVLNGYNDWFLPSLGELNLMRKNLFFAGLGGFRGMYWSSSEQRNRHAMALSFSNTESFTIHRKNIENSVRAVRAF